MKYVNKNTGDIIGIEVYSQLSLSAKDNFIAINDDGIKSHQVIETKSDNLSVGDALGLAVVLPIAIVLSIFD